MTAGAQPRAGGALDLADGAALALGVWIVAISLLPFQLPRDVLGGVPWDLPVDPAAPPTARGIGEHALAFGVWALAAGVAGWGVRPGRGAAFAVLACAVLELLQALVPGRHPTVWDWTTNSGAVLVGFALGVWLRACVGGWVVPAVAVYRLAFAAGAAALCVLLARAQTGYTLGTWDPTQQLVVGNEADGGRPWRGRIGSVALYGRALAATEVAALHAAGEPARAALRRRAGALVVYRPVGGALLEQTGSGLAPPRLAPAGGVGAPVRAGLLPVAGGRAPLRGDAPAAGLVGRLARGAAFSVELTCAVDDLRQFGPARIVTCSRDAYSRNFTVGQDGDALVLRVRCTATGSSAARYEARWRPVFARGAPLHLVAVYDRGTMRLYRDGQAWGRRFSLREARAGERVATSGGALATALLWFLPLGILLGRARLHRRRGVRVGLGALGAVAPAVLVVAFCGALEDRPAVLPFALLGLLALAAGDHTGIVVSAGAVPSWWEVTRAAPDADATAVEPGRAREESRKSLCEIS